VSLVVVILAYILVSAFPLEKSLPVLLVVEVLSLVGVAAMGSRLFPLSVPLFEPRFELAGVVAAIAPRVLPEALRFSILVLPYVDVAVCEEIWTISMSQALDPLSFILVAITPFMNAIAVWLAVFPLAHVGLTIIGFPDSIACFRSLIPFSIVNLSRFPGIDSFSMRLTSLVLALVEVSTLGKEFKSASISHIVYPLTFIHSSIGVYLNSDTMSYLFTFLC
jgi:hypothetical protein